MRECSLRFFTFDQIILKENMFHSLMYIYIFFTYVFLVIRWLFFFSLEIGEARGRHRNLVSQSNKVLDYKAPELGSGTASTRSKAKTPSKKFV